MQLVEQGKLALDDSAQLEALPPELRDVKVLQSDGSGGVKLVAKERRLTLRMLLNHTSGFGYAFEDPKLLGWSRPIEPDDFSSNVHDVLHRPLLKQPGTNLKYGVGLDRVGRLVGRLTGLSLETYFQTFILRPLEIQRITFFRRKI
ncbi:serine hydrolase domain-containing protein [Aspergillus homomorphus CBS 101889]|uniref:Beta-lactamase/transpeptidase-like protein n=1 Tax=Aspergillus homomorphus (strain CBS 101889) TaxID=1450537 RepID=A0A395I4T5_ASPHC|nr:beta-lactamase/transpeptidase-like protein [Aspergillus homomorphus CBS 101889]RAL14785.1 beta-lactamase/transpeptidase-like protein [Aspergillus homomorphus CBS 101889]